MKRRDVLRAGLFAFLGAMGLAACGSDVLSAATEHSMGVFTNGAERIDDKIEAGPMAQRKAECVKEDGIWVEDIVISECENNLSTVTIDGVWDAEHSCEGGTGDHFTGLCTHRDSSGRLYFNDGPSVPAVMQQASEILGESLDQTNYMSLFWAAGVAHDYCYHHNPITRGLTQQQCDRNFLSDLSATCVQPTAGKPWFSQTGCQFYASSLYSAVKAGGRPSFETLNTYVDYPEWMPLWKQYGMEGEVIDEELKEQIDEVANELPF